MFKIIERLLAVIGAFFFTYLAVVQAHELTLPILAASGIALYYYLEAYDE